MNHTQHPLMSRVKSFALLTIGVAAIFFVAWNIIKEQQKRQGIEEVIMQNEEEAALVENKIDELKKKISYLETDESTEQLARERGYQKEGESVAIVPDIEQVREIVQEQKGDDVGSLVQDEAKPNWKLWWEAFFKI